MVDLCYEKATFDKADVVCVLLKQHARQGHPLSRKNNAISSAHIIH